MSTTLLLLLSIFPFFSWATPTSYKNGGLEGAKENILENVTFNFNAECGMRSNEATYASFGYELQIFNCSHIVFHTNILLKNKSGLVFDWAPLYDSITYVTDTTKFATYTIATFPNGAVHSTDGSANNFDWYKNTSSMLYYLGNVPLLEAYLYQKFLAGQATLKIGRIKNLMSFDDHEMIWGQDAMFAPYAYFLSKDLYTGVVLDSKMFNNLIDIQVGVLAGDGNPGKGYVNYLGHKGSPNLQSNNTPRFSGKFNLNYGNLLPDYIEGNIFAALESGVIGSTWTNQLQEGKNNRDIANIGTQIKFNYGTYDQNSIQIFGQWTRFKSGLKTKSSQYKANLPYMEDIVQNGYLVGVGMRHNQFEWGAAYEQFDRFDRNLLTFSVGKDTQPAFYDYRFLMGSEQTSRIVHFKYYLNDFTNFQIAYHNISNPAPIVSNIIKENGDNRFKGTVSINW